MAEQNRQDWLHDLAVRAKQGDRDAMDHLLAAPDIRNVVYKTANDKVGPANADDVYQQVRERIWQKLTTWQGHATITSWVKRITWNECIDFLRKTKPQTFVSTDALPDVAQEPDQYLVILDQEKDAILAKALDALDKRCGQMLTLFLLEGQDKQVIMQAVRLKKTSFYDAFQACCRALERKIRQYL